jgi:hypothetical protein
MPGELRLACICGTTASGEPKPKKLRDALIREFWEVHSGEGHGPQPGTKQQPLFKGRKRRN